MTTGYETDHAFESDEERHAASNYDSHTTNNWCYPGQTTGTSPSQLHMLSIAPGSSCFSHKVVEQKKEEKRTIGAILEADRELGQRPPRSR